MRFIHISIKYSTNGVKHSNDIVIIQILNKNYEFRNICSVCAALNSFPVACYILVTAKSARRMIIPL